MPDKAAAREVAARLGLAVADKPDSQDICFVPNGSYADLVAKLRPEAAEPGDIVTEDGSVLGRHQGVGRYTVGQAKRLGGVNAGGEGRVVVRLESGAKRVVVGPRTTGTARLMLREMNWLIDPAEGGVRCHVKLRARDGLRAAKVIPANDAGAMVELEELALPAPGQGCVLYAGERVLGGGFISRTP